MRKRAHTVDFFTDCPRVLSTPIPGCGAHVLHRVIVSAISEDRIVGDCHAVAYTCSLPRHQGSLQTALKDHLDKFLVWDTDLDPDPQCIAHTRALASHFLLKSRRERGRAEEFGHVNAQPSGAHACNAPPPPPPPETSFVVSGPLGLNPGPAGCSRGPARKLAARPV